MDIFSQSQIYMHSLVREVKKDEATASGGRLVFVRSGVMCRVKRGSLRSGMIIDGENMNDGKFHCGVLIRVGSTEKILDQYENRYLRFGCPANWINYANMPQDGMWHTSLVLLSLVRRFKIQCWLYQVLGTLILKSINNLFLHRHFL